MMRVIVDALGAIHGGLATYVSGLLRGWSEVAPEDELTVLLTEPFSNEIASDPQCARHRLIVCPQRVPRIAWRLIREESLIPRFQSRTDALLSTSPSMPVLWHKPAVAVISDLRHEDRPNDFTVPVRLLRHVQFGNAFRRAERLIAISNRTAQVLRAHHPSTISRISVVHFGADHINGPASTRGGPALAFGQYAAKGATLLLRAWELLLRDSNYGEAKLHIVGLGESQRAKLRLEAQRLGVAHHVILDRYLDAEDFDILMGSASAVLLPSRYEGFGLPVLEAMRRKVPVMISSDPALREVAAGHAACAASWAPEDVTAAIRRALSMSGDEMNAARAHADRFTWRRTAELTRSVVELATRNTDPLSDDRGRG
jgi:glycosyltransferase involved in cell wall biosynthesis